MCVCVCVCVCVSVCARARVRVCVCMCMCAHAHTHVRACLRAPLLIIMFVRTRNCELSPVQMLVSIIAVTRCVFASLLCV